MRSFALMLIAATLIALLFLPLLIGQTVRFFIMREPLTKLWWAVAIGLDQLGGSILYGEPDWTISSRTYWLRNNGNRYAAWFERFINVFFGGNHCQESYQKEFGNELSLKEK